MTGVVIGLGDGTAAAAGLASATGRRLVGVRDVEALVGELPSHPDVSVTVSGGSSLTSRDLAAVTATATRLGQRIGFIPGWVPEQAERFVQKLRTYSWLEDRDALLWSHAGVGRLGAGRFGATEFVAADGDMSAPLAIPRHAAALITHGNGVDGPLGRTILCSALTDKTAGAGRGFLPCGYPDGPCVRAETEQGVLVPPARFRPQDVAADVVIWSACYGVLTAESLFDPARSLAVDFAASPWAGAFLSTYKDIEDEVWPSLLALAMLAEGHALGEICRELNRLTALVSEGDTPWLLLGDPDKAFAPTRLALGRVPDAGNLLVLQPGINLVTLPSTAPSVVTVGSPSGDPVSAADVFVRQIPASDRVVVLHASADPAQYVVRAQEARCSIRFTAIRGIRSTFAGPAFSLMVLDELPSNPMATAFVDQGPLRSALAARLERHLGLAGGQSDIGLAGNLSGPDSDSAGHVGEIAGWVELNSHLAEFLATYCSGAGTLNTPVAAPRALLGRPRVRAAPCPYCGMPVTERDSVLPLLGMRRRTNWCFRCGLLSDASDEVTGLTLMGPATLRPGVTYTYRLEFENSAAADWRVVHASLRIERVPWPVQCSGAMRTASATAGQALPSISLPVSLGGDVPPGVYYLVAAVAAQGDLWTGRRTVVVDPPGEAPVR